jgi:hypothetical protein
MIKMETKILIKDVIINENGDLSIFWKVKFTSIFQYVIFEFDSSVFIFMCFIMY